MERMRRLGHASTPEDGAKGDWSFQCELLVGRADRMSREFGRDPQGELGRWGCGW
jgi:hypothetical protein